MHDRIIRHFRTAETMLTAQISRLAGPWQADAAWDAPPWRDAVPLAIRRPMGGRPDHFPQTAVKVAYDDKAVYVMFRVEDRYVRATARSDQESVCGDSCVEFFFTPGSDPSVGYFNLEMNCGGTMLFHFHPKSAKAGVAIPTTDCDRIVRAHSLPRMVEPEIPDPVTWTVAYAVPVALLARYAPASPPRPRAVWRANFYKCADHSSHPHWLTWSPVDSPKPNFHLPRSFGLLEFAG